MRSLLLLALAAAGAAHADVGLLPAVVSGAGLDPAAVARSVEEVARGAVPGGLTVLGEGALAVEGPGCLEAPACLARGMARLGVDELARVEVEGSGQALPFGTARLTVWGSDGAVAFSATQALSGDRDLRGLLLRAFDPARATARLDVDGLLPGEVLLIDGLPSPPAALLAPGAHTLVVVHADGSRSTETLTLAFDERRSFALPRRPAPGEATWPPGLVPGLVGAGVGVLGLVGAGGLALVAAGGPAPPQGDGALVGAAVAGSVGILGGLTAIVALWPASNGASPPTDRPPSP